MTATFSFYGKESHAASAPEKGISALDALIQSYNAINSLRQFFTDDVRITESLPKAAMRPISSLDIVKPNLSFAPLQPIGSMK